MFLQSVGDNGFAPTALAVHPQTGDLFVSIGGRGTRGAVYRIHYAKNNRPIDPSEVAKWQPKPRSPDWRPALAKELPKAQMTNTAARLTRPEGSAGCVATSPPCGDSAQLLLGDIVGAKAKGTVFEGYTRRHPQMPSTTEAEIVSPGPPRRLPFR